jgi:glycosyltransferase involved in cell wall biosynthesis
MESSSPFISIVVPTYNEEKDIARTMDSLLALRYPYKEIVVVDDSTDRTPEILERYKSKEIKVYREKHEGGRCGARNLGIRKAKGEIVVILNADVCPDPDFLDRILPHYQNGADFLIVENRVANVNRLFPRYVDAVHKMKVDLKNYAWTEGFSCRREAALAVGLFPTDTPLPYCGGEDVIFGLKLRERFKKTVDGSIVVSHYFPDTLRDFWANRWQRGWGVPVFKFFGLKLPLYRIVAITMAKTILGVLNMTLLLPHLFSAWRVSSFSSMGVRDFLPFVITSAVERIAMILGEWEGLINTVRYRRCKQIDAGSLSK